jgi:outer membrane protein TolC
MVLTYQLKAQENIEGTLASSKNWNSFEVKKLVKPLSLGGAIQQGTQQNHDQINREFQKEIIEIDWKDQWSSFWLPEINLSLSINPHRIAQLRRTSALVGSQSRNTGGQFSLNLGQYSLFNWGKDYLGYLNSKQSYRRNKQNLIEQKRELKFSIVEDYSDLVTSKNRLKTYKKILRHASYAYRMAKEKVEAKKLSLQNYYMIRTLYLESYENYISEKRYYQSANEKLAFTLDDEVNTRYSINEDIKFKRVLTPLSTFFDFARNNNPGILQTYTNQKISERNLEIARRENLGLPEFTIDLGAFSRTTTTVSQNQGYSGGTSGNENLEIIATLNATWALVGENGFLNQRKLSRANLNNRSATRLYKKAVDQNLYLLTNAYQRLKTYEEQWEVTQTKMISAKTGYEITLEKYNRSKTTFLNFLQNLTDYAQAEVALADLINNHLKEKVNLARYSGIDDLPDLLFEHVTLDDQETTEYKSFRKNTPAPENTTPSEIKESTKKNDQSNENLEEISDLDEIEDLDLEE